MSVELLTNTSYYPRPVPQSMRRVGQLIGSRRASSNQPRRGFSLWRALGNFGRGLISPITSLFSSTRNFLLGAAMIIGGAALIIATGGAAAPILIGIGLGMASVQAGVGVYKIATAENAEQAEAAFHDFGSATGVAALSVLGARGALRPVGVSTQGMGRFSATVQCVRSIPTSARLSVNAFRSGQWRTNFSNFGTATYNFFTRRGVQQAPPQSTSQTQVQPTGSSPQQSSVRIISPEELPPSMQNSVNYARRHGNVTIELVENPPTGFRPHAEVVETIGPNGLRQRTTTVRVSDLSQVPHELGHTNRLGLVRPPRRNPQTGRLDPNDVRRYMAERLREELMVRARRAPNQNPNPSAANDVRRIQELISQGKYREAISFARSRGLGRNYRRGYVSDARETLVSNGRRVVQRGYSSSIAEEFINSSKTIEELQVARTLAAEEGMTVEQVNALAQRRINQWIQESEFHNFDRLRNSRTLAEEVGMNGDRFLNGVKDRARQLATQTLEAGGELSPAQEQLLIDLGLRNWLSGARVRARTTTTETTTSGVSSRAQNLLESAQQNPNTVTPEALTTLMEAYGFSWRHTKGGHGRLFSHGSIRVGAAIHSDSGYVKPVYIRKCLDAIAQITGGS